MTQSGSPRIAVLIDGENVSHAVADGLFAALAPRGDPCIRRIFGDFATPRMTAWSAAIRAHGMTPRHQPCNTPGKNAADIGLVIDAMELLHGGRVEAFCIVSSDADFSQLARHLREQGRIVIGAGRQGAAPSLRSAFSEFLFLESLIPTRPTAPGSAPPEACTFGQAVALIEAAAYAGGDRQGWIALSALGQALRRHAPGFSCRQYGAATFSGLAEATGRFEVDRSGGRLRCLPGAITVAS